MTITRCDKCKAESAGDMNKVKIKAGTQNIYEEKMRKEYDICDQCLPIVRSFLSRE